MFAKLFGPDDEQVLVELGYDEEGDPQISFKIDLTKHGMYIFPASFTFVTYEAAEYAFNNLVDEAYVTEVRDAVFNGIFEV